MIAANFSDPGNARIIFLTAAALVVLAAGLTAATVWWWRASRVEHPALAPLEVMGTKSWLEGDDEARQNSLALARPAEALAVEVIVDDSAALDLFASLKARSHEGADLFEPFGHDVFEDHDERPAPVVFDQFLDDDDIFAPPRDPGVGPIDPLMR